MTGCSKFPRNKRQIWFYFPESFLPAYPRGLSFGTVVGSRSQEGRNDWLLYWENAVQIPGETHEQLAALAKKYQVFLAIGVTERDQNNYSLYCSMLIYNPEGRLIHHHRKIKPTAAERFIWAEGNGNSLEVKATSLGKMGGLICWENYMLQARMKLYQQGVEIYLAPTADSRDTWQATMQHIACEGRCYVLGANQFVTKDQYPEQFQEELKAQPEVMCRGGSVIISPLGEVLAGPLFHQEGILSANIDMENIIKSKLDFDVIGHYSRPDLF